MGCNKEITGVCSSLSSPPPPELSFPLLLSVSPVLSGVGVGVVPPLSSVLSAASVVSVVSVARFHDTLLANDYWTALGDGGTDATLGTHHVEHVGGGHGLHRAIVVELVLHAAADLRIDGEQVAELHAVPALHVAQYYAHVAGKDGVDKLGRDAKTFHNLFSQVCKVERAE